GFLVLQGYGLTETSPVVTLNSPQAFKPGSVGRSLPGTEVVIADDGEVLVHGESVTMGYFGDPQRTGETIIDGWLHTGDLGYTDQEGFLFLRGRKKDLIITPAGLNVYPEDVEGVFRRLPGVRDVAVLEFEGQVHAVLLLERSEDARALVEQANANLAEHQRVQEYTIWPEEDFPHTTTHKPKKHEIRAMLEQMARGGAPPQPSQEEQSVGEVERILGRVSGKSASAVTPEARLGDDLGLDSLDRIELVGWLEEQLNTEVAEEELTEETAVQDLKQMVGQGATQHLHFACWALSRPVCVARRAFQQGLVFPIYNRIVRQYVQGLEHLDNLDGPIIFTPNHTSYLDTVAVLQALPPRFRQRLAPAQYAEFFEVPPGRMDLWLRKKFLFFFLTLGFNIYLLAQTRGVRQSLQYTGELIDKGWNVLVFPEGRRTYSGVIGPFREGIGILAAEMRVPVVPVHIEGLYKVLPRHRSRPHRGDVVVHFGKPLEFCKESYGDFTQHLEDAVRSLGTPEKSRC
ncbi:MAG TPA: 1-acyl-sn-glycerol-3-phosphate acyltransferase, partial [Dehalococcoidia bacterium]|nr:1-acyl-sn-glycerol-3-phosphate acyltransferase [Dehalococcoidia bacterium]